MYLGVMVQVNYGLLPNNNKKDGVGGLGRCILVSWSNYSLFASYKIKMTGVGGRAVILVLWSKLIMAFWPAIVPSGE